MSRINTNILRVPGASGQIDERPLAKFMAPMEAAADAMEGLGELAQNIAVKEQQSKDAKASAEILNEWTQYEAEIAAKLAEAPDSKTAAALTAGLKEKHAELFAKTDGIGGREIANQTRHSLNLKGGLAQIGVETRARRLLINEERFEVIQTAKTAWQSAVMTGNLEAGMAEVRRLLENSKGSAWSKEQIESTYESIVGRPSYLEARIAIESGESVDLSKLPLTMSEHANLKLIQLAKESRSSDMANNAEMSRGPGQAIEAAAGIYEGKYIGHTEALDKLLEKSASLKFPTEGAKQDYLKSVRNIYTSTLLNTRIYQLSVQDKDVEGLQELHAAIIDNPMGLPLSEKERLANSISTRVNALVAEGYKEQAEMDSQKRKRNKERLDGYELSLQKTYYDAKEQFKLTKNPQAAAEAFKKAAFSAVGIEDGIDYDNYEDGAVAFFEAEFLAQKYYTAFVKEVGHIKTWEEVEKEARAGKPEAITQLSFEFVKVDPSMGTLDDSKLVQIGEWLTPENEFGEKGGDFLPMEQLKEVRRLRTVMTMSKLSGDRRLPAVFDRWASELNMELTPERRIEMFRTITRLASDPGMPIDLRSDFTSLTEQSRAQLVTWALNSHLEDKERLSQAMDAKVFDVQEARKRNSWAQDEHYAALNVLIKEDMGLPEGEKAVLSALTNILQQRGFSEEQAISRAHGLSPEFTERLMGKMEGLFAGKGFLDITGDAFTADERSRFDAAFDATIRETVRDAGISILAGDPRGIPSARPPEMQLPRNADGEVAIGPLVNALTEQILEMSDEQGALYNALGDGTFDWGRTLEVAKGYHQKKITFIGDRAIEWKPHPSLVGAGAESARVWNEVLKKQDALSRGEITETEFRDFVKSKDVYEGLKHGWTDTFYGVTQGAKDMAFDAANWATFKIFSHGRVNDREGQLKYLQDNWAFSVSNELVPNHVKESVDGFLNALAPHTSGSLPIGNSQRHVMLAYPKVGGEVQWDAEPIKIILKRSHYANSKGVADMFRDNLEAPADMSGIIYNTDAISPYHSHLFKPQK